jgi:hypothetical protein
MKASEFYGWGVELIENLPEYWHEDDFMRQFLMALGFEFDALDRLTRYPTPDDIQRALSGTELPNDLEPIIANWFVRTASAEGLLLWEEFLGIAHDNTLSRDDQIAGIITRMRGAETPTPAYIRSQLLQYVDDLEIIEHFDLPGDDINRYSFDIHILAPVGISTNVQVNITNLVKKIKPSHLGFLIVWTEVTWHDDAANMGDRTWADLGDMTWADLHF